MRKWAVLAVLALAPLAVAQTQGHDDGTEEGEPSATASAAPPVAGSAAGGTAQAPMVMKPHAVVEKDGMVFVTGGRFTMGSDAPKAAPNEKPVHEATVDSFWIDRTEVTVGDYHACVGVGACDPPQKSSPSCTYEMGDDRLPVNCVRWQDADGFCRAAHKRLPKEAEWELAARGGGAFKYPWGNAASSCLVAATLLHDGTGRSCTGKRPARVGSYAANVSPFGALDMAGNVEEWTASWYVDHVASGARPTSGASHVLRGGGWTSRPIDARTTARNWGSSVEAGPNVGFRCARDL